MHEQSSQSHIEAHKDLRRKHQPEQLTEDQLARCDIAGIAYSSMQLASSCTDAKAMKEAASLMRQAEEKLKPKTPACDPAACIIADNCRRRTAGAIAIA